MSADTNRWMFREGEFASRVDIRDIAGFFSKSLTVEPGTLALVMQDGQSLGQVPPGHYTLETFGDNLSFWRRKQTLVILARQEDLPLNLYVRGIPTADNLFVDVQLRLTVQIDDVALLQRNLLGQKEKLSISELVAAIEPLVQQAVWEAVGRQSIASVNGPEAAADIDAAVEQALGASLRRYGLKFGRVQSVQVSHEGYEEHRRELGASWLEQLKRREQVKTAESDAEIQTLADQVATDRMEGELGVMLRRVGIREEMRKAVLSDQFSKLKTNDERARFLQEIDKAKLLRQDEVEVLTRDLSESQEDHQRARDHLLRKLELEQQAEREQVRADLDQTMRLRRLSHEIELAKVSDTEDNRRWQQMLQRQVQEAENRRRQEIDEQKHQHTLALGESQHRQGQEWDALLQAQRTVRLRGEVEFAQSENRIRVARLEEEFATQRRESELAFAGRKAEAEQDIRQRGFSNQVERIKALNELNISFARQQQELRERQQRSEVDMEVLRADKASERELARIAALQGASQDVMIATASVENAKLLADVAKAQVEAAGNATHRAELERMQAKLAEAANAKGDAVAAALRDALASGQQMTAQMLETFSRVAQAQQPQQTTFVSGGAPIAGITTGGQPAAPATIACPQCSTHVAATSAFCTNCGKQLRVS